VEDGIMRDVAGAPRTDSDWAENNPIFAIDDFLGDHPEFERFEPTWKFNESVDLTKNVTYFRDGWLRRRISSK
jgi:cephalosporin hydroxylase